MGYRPSRTLPIRAEIRRQASRRRTQLALGFMVLLPLIILVGVRVRRRNDDSDDNGGGGAFGSLVDLATSGGLNFALFCLAFSAGFLLVVVVALFCGDTVASEASWGSLRYLLAVPVPRARLLGVKLIVALPTRCWRCSCWPARRCSSARCATAGIRWAARSPPSIPPGQGVLRLLGVLGYLAVTMLVVAGLAFLLSVSTDAALGAVGGAVLLWILSSILDQITALGGIRNVLPTHYSDAWLGLLSTPPQVDDLVKGAITAVCYATLFWALAFWRFTRKDITS